MFEPTRLVLRGEHRVLLDFDGELEKLFGTPPRKWAEGLLRNRGKAAGTIKFSQANAKEFFSLNSPEELAAGMKKNQENLAEPLSDFFEAK